MNKCKYKNESIHSITIQRQYLDTHILSHGLEEQNVFKKMYVIAFVLDWSFQLCKINTSVNLQSKTLEMDQVGDFMICVKHITTETTQHHNRVDNVAENLPLFIRPLRATWDDLSAKQLSM